ncbi:MAG TPA: hypothetical protein PK250_12820 [Syntrophobacter fumaroxidans]|nr:hypothetical protein [Syntrophobacter fumaroxidans]
MIGWKDIALYLGVSQTTAKEWAGKCGLPIKKVGARGTRRSVVTLKCDLDAWQKRQNDYGREAK